VADGTNKILWPGWETVKLIGRGSFGVVYEIQRDVFGNLEQAALKVITIPQNPGDVDEMYNEGYDDESITTAFEGHLKAIVAEYSLMRKLNGCTNIVNCDDIRYVQHDDSIGWDIFIKMELLTPLLKTLPAEIPEETVIKIGEDICTALELCRENGIVHRDIKPQNIFVSKYGDYKLGDFGIAKTVEKTMGGTKIGTYKYMAPEVYNNQPYGTGADIYSLGLVLYWLLNEKRMPFLPLPPEKLSYGMEETARHRRFDGETLPAPAHGSERLKEIVLKACAYKPDERYHTAGEMRDALRQLHTDMTGAALAAEMQRKQAEELERLQREEEERLRLEREAAAEEKRRLEEAARLEREREEQERLRLKREAAEEQRRQEEEAAQLERERKEQERLARAREAAEAKRRKKEETRRKLEELQKLALEKGNELCEKTKSSGNYLLEKIHGLWQDSKARVLLPVAFIVLVIFLIIGFFTIHIWSEGSCTEPVKCVLCGKAGEEPLGHQWVSATCTESERCLVCGQLGRSALGHSWAPATTQDPQRCKTCGETKGDSLREVTSITVVNMENLTNRDYYVGDEIKPGSLAIGVTYSDGFYEPLSTGFTVSPQVLTEEGVQQIVISYHGVLTSFWIDVRPAVQTGQCGDSLTWELDRYGNMTIIGNGSMTVWYDITEVPWHNYREEIRTLEFEGNVLNIGDYAFSRCYNLRHITFSENLISIDHWAFGQCTSLTSIVLPSQVQKIGSMAFADCISLKEIFLPAKLGIIDWGAFLHCSALTDVCYAGNQQQWDAVVIYAENLALEEIQKIFLAQ